MNPAAMPHASPAEIDFTDFELNEMAASLAGTTPRPVAAVAGVAAPPPPPAPPPPASPTDALVEQAFAQIEQPERPPAPPARRTIPPGERVSAVPPPPPPGEPRRNTGPHPIVGASRPPPPPAASLQSTPASPRNTGRFAAQTGQAPPLPTQATGRTTGGDLAAVRAPAATAPSAPGKPNGGGVIDGSAHAASAGAVAYADTPPSVNAAPSMMMAEARRETSPTTPPVSSAAPMPPPIPSAAAGGAPALRSRALETEPRPARAPTAAAILSSAPDPFAEGPSIAVALVASGGVASDGQTRLEVIAERPVEDGEELRSDDIEEVRGAPPPPPGATPRAGSGLAFGNLASSASSASRPAAAAETPRPPATGRRRSRSWFEELFDEDYIRTLPFLTAIQTEREVNFIIEALRLTPGSEVLDLGCGYGRHAMELASRGYQVTGMDLSLPLLIRAADTARSRNLSINFVHGDMREMAFDRGFDAIYCFQTSFGYFDDETNRKVMSLVARAMRPSGHLLLDVINRDYLIANLPTRVWWQGVGCMVLEEVSFNYFTSRLQVQRSIVFEDGRQVDQEISIRAYSLHEIGKLLHQAGLRVVEVSGGLALRGRFYGADSRSILVVAERKSDS